MGVQARGAGYNPMNWVIEGYIDAEADIPLAEALGAICVQRFDDETEGYKGLGMYM